MGVSDLYGRHHIGHGAMRHVVHRMRRQHTVHHAGVG
jgi:hypothetical protein